jgi:hypothetical protein
MRTSGARAAILVSSLLAGCGGADGGTPSPLPPPTAHRPAPTACPADRQPGRPPAYKPPGSACTTDADCTAGRNGRCEENLGPSVCSYDACIVDGDCGGSSVCVCRLSTNYDANTCFHGNCKVDAECGPGAYCSPSGPDVDSSCRTGLEPGSFGFFCHTAQDACVDDRDCPANLPWPQKCLFDPTARHWACFDMKCTEGL